MMKKLIALICILSLCFAFSGITAFATEEESSIAPFDSTLVVDLNTETWNIIYSGSLPVLFPQTLSITSSAFNLGDVEIRVMIDGALYKDNIVSPGSSIAFGLPTSLGGTYQVQARAVTVAGAYGLITNQGDAGEEIIITQASPDSWTTIFTGDVPLLMAKNLLLTNHVYSPSAVEVRVIDIGSGMPIGTTRTIQPGNGGAWTIQPDIEAITGATFNVEIKAVTNTPTEAPYFILLDY